MTTPTLPALIDVQTVSSLVEQNAFTLIDVRTPAEYESEHIANSHNIPLDLLPAYCHELCETLQSPMLLVCRSGNRAKQAEQLLRQHEVPVPVHVLEGGLIAWRAAGQAVNRGMPRWSLERQVRGVAGLLVLLGIIGSFFWRPLRLVAGFVGAGLAFSAVTDSCAMGLMLSKLPYNRSATCDVQAVLKQLRTGSTK